MVAAVRIAKLLALRLLGSECIPGTLRDQPTLLLGQRGVEVQQERIDVGTQLGDDELDALRHQAADEVNVAAEPVQLGDRDRALAMLGLSQRGSQLRAACKRVGTFAGLDLDELTGQLEALGLTACRT